MNPFAILSLLFGLSAFVLFLWKAVAKERAWKYVHFPLAGSYVLFFVFFVLWAKYLYQNDDPNLAMWTFAVGALFFGTILCYPYNKDKKALAYANMTLFLLLGVALIILAVCLSKTIMQPGATY